jgi:hypothetical protein
VRNLRSQKFLAGRIPSFRIGTCVRSDTRAYTYVQNDVLQKVIGLDDESRLEKDVTFVIWHGTSLWVIGPLVFAVIVWFLLQGRLRARQYRRVAEELGFIYLSSTVAETLDLSKASFREPWDIATNVIVGTFKGVETVALYFHANHGEVGYKQTTVAMKSSTPIVDVKPLAVFWDTRGTDRGVDRHV